MSVTGESGEQPTRLDGEDTSTFLARILVDEGAPEWMVSLARDHHYHDFKSPLAMPEMQLLGDARANDLPRIAAWVIDGVFDATKVESDEWAKSPDGQAAFRELLGGAKNRAQRRADDKRRRRGH